MSCEEALRVLELTVGGTLGEGESAVGAAERAELERHVASCRACAEVRDELRRMADLAGDLMTADARIEATADAALAAAVDRRLAAEPAPQRRILRLRTVAARAAVVAAAIAAGFAWTAWRSRGGPVIDLASYPLAPPRVEGYDGPRFTDVTTRAGIRNVDHTGVAGRKDWMVETVGHGAAAFDMDGDGDLDLFVPDGNRLNPTERVTGTWRLYRNDGGLRFADVTADSGLDVDSWGDGAVAGDVDGDGRPDLFVPCFGKNHLFRNLGGGRFEDVGAAAGVAGEESEWSTAAAMGDLDGDGDLDLFVTNYADMRRYMAEARDGRGCKWRSMAVACGPVPLQPQRDRLYLNRGDGTFVDATEERVPVLRRYSFQAIIADLDRDGALDVYVACDAQENLLLHNDGTARFTEIGRSVGAASNKDGAEQASMGVAAGDVDDDGRIDIHVTNFSHEPDCLYRNIGSPSMRFIDVTSAARLEGPTQMTLGWGTSFADIDNDGDLDLLCANGHLYPGVEEAVPETTYAQHVEVFRNDGTGRFLEVTAEAGEVLRPRVHRGLVAADLDDDGATDLFLTVLNDRAVLLRNDARGVGRSTRFLLRRRGGNVEAAGASLVADVEGVPGRARITRDLLLGSSFGCSEDPRVAIGLGTSGRITAAHVRWPGVRAEPGAVAPEPSAVLPPEGEAGFEPGATYVVEEGLPRARRVR